jgi:hypothetical protein
MIQQSVQIQIIDLLIHNFNAGNLRFCRQRMVLTSKLCPLILNLPEINPTDLFFVITEVLRSFTSSYSGIFRHRSTVSVKENSRFLPALFLSSDFRWKHRLVRIYFCSSVVFQFPKSSAKFFIFLEMK